MRAKYAIHKDRKKHPDKRDLLMYSTIPIRGILKSFVRIYGGWVSEWTGTELVIQGWTDKTKHRHTKTKGKIRIALGNPGDGLPEEGWLVFSHDDVNGILRAPLRKTS